MEKIRVKKETVLKTLVENREIHRSEYKEAIEGWINKAKGKLTEILKELDSDHAQDVKVEFYLPKPISYEKEYDKAIKMIEFEIREEVEISTQDFEKYFLDEWAWKENFLSNTGLYKRI